MSSKIVSETIKPGGTSCKVRDWTVNAVPLGKLCSISLGITIVPTSWPVSATKTISLAFSCCTETLIGATSRQSIQGLGVLSIVVGLLIVEMTNDFDIDAELDGSSCVGSTGKDEIELELDGDSEALLVPVLLLDSDDVIDLVLDNDNEILDETDTADDGEPEIDFETLSVNSELLLGSRDTDIEFEREIDSDFVWELLFDGELVLLSLREGEIVASAVLVELWLLVVEDESEIDLDGDKDLDWDSDFDCVLESDAVTVVDPDIEIEADNVWVVVADLVLVLDDDGVLDGVLELVIDGVSLGEFVGVWVDERETVEVGDGVFDSEFDGVCVTVPETELVPVFVGDLVGVSVFVGVPVFDGVPVVVLVFVGVLDVVIDCVGVSDCDLVLDGVGVFVGVLDALFVVVGVPEPVLVPVPVAETVLVDVFEGVWVFE